MGRDDGREIDPELAAAVLAYVAGEPVNVSVMCRRLGVSRKTFYKYAARYAERGLAGFTQDSRRPRTSPSRTTPADADAIVAARAELKASGFDYGAWAIRTHLTEHRGPTREGAGSPVPSEATINRVLAVRGLRELVPARRPRSSWTRFEREKVNSLWQMDGFDVTLGDGQQVVVIHVSDDCSRKDLALHVAPSESGAAAWEAFVKASAEHGLPMELLTDNARAFNGSRMGFVSQMEKNTRALGVRQIASRQNHPQTAGKNERAHQRFRKWLRARPLPSSPSHLQALVEDYRHGYNHRQNRVLGGLTPAQRYTLGPVARPAAEAATTRILGRQVSINGLTTIDGHRFFVGKRHALKPTVVVQVGAEFTFYVGNILAAEFTLNPNRSYQLKRPKLSPKS